MQLKCSHWVHYKYYTGFPTGAHVAISNLQLYKSMTCWNLRRFISLQCLLCKIFVLVEKITSHFTKLTLFILLQDYVILYTPHFRCRNLEFRFFNPSQILMSGLQWGTHNCEQQLHRDANCMAHIGTSYLCICHNTVHHCITTPNIHKHTHKHKYPPVHTPHTVCILATRLITDFFCLLILNLQCIHHKECPSIYDIYMAS